MKYLNNYKLWKKINEELNDSTIIDAANQHEKEGRPQKADDLRTKVEPNYKDEFKFYFFPLSIKGDIVTFRAYVDNRADAVKLSRILKIFNNLTGLPEVNNLWREIEKAHKSEGLVTVDYSRDSRFIFKPSGGYFVTHHNSLPKEVEVGPIILRDEYPITQKFSMLGDVGAKFIDHTRFEKSGPYQIIKINFDPKEGILKADIKIDLNHYHNENIIKLLTKEEKPKEIENCDELINAIGMYSQRPKASLEKLSQLRPNLADIFNKEITFVLRKAVNAGVNHHDLVNISKDPNNTSNIYKAYVESDKDAKDINEVIKLFLQLKSFKSDGNIMPVDGYNEDDLITEKKEGDVEVKAKFIPVIAPELRSKDSFEFFGFQFKIEEDKFGKNNSRILTDLLDDTAYITLIDEYSDSFKGSKLFTIIPKY